MLQVWGMVEETAAWLMMALVALLVIVLLLAGARRNDMTLIRSMFSASAFGELMLGVACFAVVSGVGRTAVAAGASSWQAGMLCIVCGAFLLPLLLRAHTLIVGPEARHGGSRPD